MFDFKTIQVQASILTPELPSSNQKLLAFFLSKRGDLFNGEPITYDQPTIWGGPYIPRLILSSEDKTLRIHVSSGRFDVIRFTLSPTVGVDQDAHLELAVDLFGEYLGITKGTAGKLSSAVVNATPDDDPPRTISRRFCRDEWLTGPIVDPTSFDLGVQQAFVLAEGMDAIGWLRCRTGELVNPVSHTVQGKAIVIEQDLSTRGDDPTSREFTLDEIRRFFILAPGEQRRIFSSYFPSQERSQ